MRYPLNNEERKQMREELENPLVSRVHDKAYYNICSHCRILFKELDTDLQKEILEEIVYLAKKMNEELQDRKWVLMEDK